jgi:hypothetical protein
MRDRYLIAVGLVLFIGLVTAPIWYDRATGVTAKGPAPILPTGQKTCVAPTAYMRTSHMTLLLSWRDGAVREGVRTYVAFDGRSHTISLTGTCLSCHASKADFCDRCHTYAGIAPVCWDCHIDPAAARRSGG